MTQLIQEIVQMVRKIARYNPDIADAVNVGTVSAELRVKDDIPVLHSVTFAHYDQVIVTRTSMILVTEFSRKTISHHKSFEDFIKKGDIK